VRNEKFKWPEFFRRNQRMIASNKRWLANKQRHLNRKLKKIKTITHFTEKFDSEVKTILQKF
jgi:phage antirepressor YoqD-like protein